MGRSRGGGEKDGGRYGTRKLEIFIAASFPFYAESRDRDRLHSTHLDAIRHRDVIMSVDTPSDTAGRWKVTIEWAHFNEGYYREESNYIRFTFRNEIEDI